MPARKVLLVAAIVLAPATAAATDYFAASASMPVYAWEPAVTCGDAGVLLVRQPVLPGRLGVVMDLGCDLAYLDFGGRRVRVQTLAGRDARERRFALWAVPLEWTAGEQVIGACVGGGCAPLRLRVEDVPYPKSEIKVAKKFASPPPSEQERIKRDRVNIDRAFAAGMFDGGLEAPMCSLQQFTLPFVLPRPPLYTSLFGALRIINKEKHTRHLGTDFDGEVGEPIVAAADGTVVLAEDLYFSGNSVFISHGLGLFTTYFHMTKIDAKSGDHVFAGQKIGTIGRTGRVTGPHLHFSAKLWGYYFDPAELFELDGWLPDVD
ncbi:MAG: M23 family metallopeptidase [Deltaproteobacteria bacterium]|nr:M23 family metallopeptidase [Deltaproteobacteria bacterium]